MKSFFLYILTLCRKVMMSVRAYIVKKRLRRTQNIFDETNYLYGGGRFCHTKWGRHSGIGENAYVYDTNVGNFTNIASNCKIGLRDHVSSNFLISDFVYTNDEQILPNGIKELNGYWVDIGSDVWIGESVIILRGVK